MTRRSLDDRNALSRARALLACLVLAWGGAAAPGCLAHFDDWPNAAAGSGSLDPEGGTSGKAAAGVAGADVINMAGSSGTSGSLGGSGSSNAAGSSPGGSTSVGGSSSAAGSSSGGASGASGVSSAGGSSGSAGSGSVAGHRYARLLALTSIPNDSLTSVAELELLDTQGSSLDRRGWTASADSQELNVSYCPASNAIDGDTQTVWQTEWGNTLAPLPHSLTIDMGAKFAVSGFIYTPRQDWYSGRIGQWEFYLSDDPSNWGTPVVSGNFSDTMDVQSRTFTPQ